MEEKNNVIDMLLTLDSRKVAELPTQKYEVERLSKILGKPFVVTLSAIGAERYAEIQRAGININGRGSVKGLHMYDMQALSLVDGMVAPSLKDKKLLQHFSAITPKDLVGKLFLAGEISKMSGIIQELSGYEKDQDEVNEEVKN